MGGSMEEAPMTDTIDFMPVTRHIHLAFQRTMSAVVTATELGWIGRDWPQHFYVVGREGAFNFFASYRVAGFTPMMVWIYRDALGYEIIVEDR
jgi:hypothetical protein